MIFGLAVVLLQKVDTSGAMNRTNGKQPLPRHAASRSSTYIYVASTVLHFGRNLIERRITHIRLLTIKD
jgi:hypothetical protein